MSDTIIQVENLGKKYLIRHQAKERYIALRDVIAGKVCSIGRRVLNPGPNKKADPTREEFWALKDVSFEIKHGEVLGIIGRNGAGKSTLLKVLSRITEPTTGRACVRGRVASLLEVGTGFHPELTGRENIFLNGAILGMGKAEIKRKFDEIVAFAEVEKFLDTPVKRYSSGMSVRLAFAVAAHLEPEILLIDEVLAVGDLQFQKKCLSKMNELGNLGKTILFVSHNLNLIQRFCSKAVLLSKGEISKSGKVGEVLAVYMKNDFSLTKKVSWNHHNSKMADDKDEIVIPLRLSLIHRKGELSNYQISKPSAEIYVKIVFELRRDEPDLTLGYSLFDENGSHLYRCLHTDDVMENRPLIAKGYNAIESRLPIEYLNEGVYKVVLDGGIYKKDWIFNPLLSQDICVSFEIINGITESEYWQTKRAGIFAPLIEWQNSKK
jgi:lipopolysaccharide transport system ATP-binding protein